MNTSNILETIKMIDEENLDIRTITMGISLLDCIDSNEKVLLEKIYNKITKSAKDLVKVGNDIEKEFGVPIVNKRVSVTPISIIGGTTNLDSYVSIAKTLDKAAEDLGIDFLGGFSALVQKGYTKGDKILINSIPEALANTNKVCASVNVGSSKAGINMDAVRDMGEIAIGVINNKTTAVRVIPAPGSKVSDIIEFGGLLGRAPVIKVNKFNSDKFIARGGRIPAPIHSFKN